MPACVSLRGFPFVVNCPNLVAERHEIFGNPGISVIRRVIMSAVGRDDRLVSPGMAGRRQGRSAPPDTVFETAELTPVALSFHGENKRVSNRLMREGLAARLSALEGP